MACDCEAAFYPSRFRVIRGKFASANALRVRAIILDGSGDLCAIGTLMVKKFMSLLAAMAVIGGAATLFAQGEAKAGEGTLMLQDKNYTLSHALAYETTINEEDVIAVVLSGQAISSEKLKKSKETEKRGRLR